LVIKIVLHPIKSIEIGEALATMAKADRQAVEPIAKHTEKDQRQVGVTEAQESRITISYD
jgi:hypothetical protein